MQVIKKLEARIALSSFSRTLLSLTFKLIVTVHSYACIVAIATTLPPTPLSSWLGTYGYCKLNPALSNTTRFEDDPICVDPAYRTRAELNPRPRHRPSERPVTVTSHGAGGGRPRCGER